MQPDSVYCICGEPLSEKLGLQPDQRAPCPKCGSLSRAFHKVLEAQVTPTASLNAVQRRPSFPGGSRVLELTQGWVPSFKYGFVNKIRRFDRILKTYLEHVELKDGTVVHHVEEPLSEHTGHGSDKRP